MRYKTIRLVLLSCCAPCSCGAIKQLRTGCQRLEIGNRKPKTLISDFIVLFFNPNIYPESEYQKRLAEQIKYCESMGVKHAVGNYNHDEWLDAIRGLESEPERGKRCSECFRHRFKFAQKFALENGYNAIASVLGVSRHKDQSQVDAAAAAVISGLMYMPIEWDKKQQSEILNNESFYRQNYCGCEFSIRKV